MIRFSYEANSWQIRMPAYNQFGQYWCWRKITVQQARDYFDLEFTLV